jgi:hypothetical protein
METDQEFQRSVKVVNARIVVNFKWMNISDVITIEMNRLIELPVQFIGHTGFTHTERTVDNDDH